MASQVDKLNQEPEFITYLFSRKLKHDCYFVLENESLVEPVRIGAVRFMLMAYSEVLRSQLEDTSATKKKYVTVSDIYPDTFKILLKYVYGYDTTADLSFDEADKMLYVAEKYMINCLKDKVAVRLMSLLNPDNVCILLNNPVCFTHLQLNSAITEILQYETDCVLASPQLLGLTVDGFAKILEQEGLAVTEIELWRAIMKWAENKAGPEGGKYLRQVSKLTKNMRVCTYPLEEFCREVVPTGVLSNDEVVKVCLSIGRKEKQDLTQFSSEIVPRKQLSKKVKEIVLSNTFSTANKESSVSILTKSLAIELLCLECISLDYPFSMMPQGMTYPVNCRVTISRITDFKNNTSSENPVTVSFSEQVEYGCKPFIIPLTTDGNGVLLLANNKYTIKMSFDNDHPFYYGGHVISNEHMRVQRDSYMQSIKSYYFHAKRLVYKALIHVNSK